MLVILSYWFRVQQTWVQIPVKLFISFLASGGGVVLKTPFSPTSFTFKKEMSWFGVCRSKNSNWFSLLDSLSSIIMGGIGLYKHKWSMSYFPSFRLLFFLLHHWNLRDHEVEIWVQISASWSLRFQGEKLFSRLVGCLPGGSLVNNLPAMQGTRVPSLGLEDLLEKRMSTHSSIPAWRIPWTEEPGGLQSVKSQRAGYD